MASTKNCICDPLMSGVHGYFSKLTREFQEDERPKSERFFRIINEFPTSFNDNCRISRYF